MSRTTSPSSGSACTRGASGAAPSSSTACTPPAPRSPTPASPGPTSTWSSAARPSATATPATSPARPSPRRSAGTAPASPRRTPPARPAPRRSTPPAPGSSPGCARSRWSSARTPRPKGFLAPNAGERWDDPDWLRFRLLGMTNPAYFAMYARRRMDLYGATSEDFAQVKVKNARHGLANPNARYRKEVSRRRRARLARSSRDPLHLLDICATSDGAAAVVLDQRRLRPRGTGSPTPVRVRGDLDGHADLPEHRARHAEPVHRLLDRRRRAGERTFKESIAHAAYEEAGIGPEDVEPGRGLRPVDRARAGLDGGPRRSASAARPRRCCAPATRRSAAGSRSTRPAAWPASARPCRPRRWPRCAR